MPDAALTLIVMVMVPTTPAAAVAGISAEFCVSETHFFYDITLTDVPQDDNTFNVPAFRGTLIIDADDNVTDTLVAQFGFEYRVMDLSSPSDFIFTNPFLIVSEFGTAPQRWQLGAFPAPDDLAIFSGDGLWTVTFSGSFGNGTEPFDPGNDPVFRVFHQERPDNNVQTLDTVPVTSCEPPVTTTQPPVTTTQPPVTTTQPPVTTAGPTTTVGPTVAPSSTLPETGLGDALRVSAPLGLGLFLAGLIALGGAALIGDRRRRQ